MLRTLAQIAFGNFFYPQNVSRNSFECLKMNRNANEFLPAILNLVTGIGVLLISFLLELRFPLPKEIAKPLGLFIVAAGMSLVICAVIHIREAFLEEKDRMHPSLLQLMLGEVTHIAEVPS